MIRQLNSELYVLHFLALMQVSRRFLIFFAPSTPTEPSSGDLVLMPINPYINSLSMLCTALLRSKTVSYVNRLLKLQLLLTKIQPSMSKHIGFRLRLSGQCMLVNIALSCFKLLLRMHARHGIECPKVRCRAV